MARIMPPKKDPWNLAAGRWGGNDQPYLEDVNYVLGWLPVAEARLLAHDRLYIRMFAKLTFSQAFTLGRLRPDDPEGIDEDQTEFIFWWD